MAGMPTWQIFPAAMRAIVRWRKAEEVSADVTALW